MKMITTIFYVNDNYHLCGTYLLTGNRIPTKSVNAKMRAGRITGKGVHVQIESNVFYEET
jgi:hypothetical protein